MRCRDCKHNKNAAASDLIHVNICDVGGEVLYANSCECEVDPFIQAVRLANDQSVVIRQECNDYLPTMCYRNPITQRGR